MQKLKIIRQVVSEICGNKNCALRQKWNTHIPNWEDIIKNTITESTYRPPAVRASQAQTPLKTKGRQNIKLDYRVLITATHQNDPALRPLIPKSLVSPWMARWMTVWSDLRPFWTVYCSSGHAEKACDHQTPSQRPTSIRNTTIFVALNTSLPTCLRHNYTLYPDRKKTSCQCVANVKWCWPHIDTMSCTASHEHSSNTKPVRNDHLVNLIILVISYPVSSNLLQGGEWWTTACVYVLLHV